jgi:hypothetical protein
MIAGRTIARLSIRGANPMSVLRNLHRSPVKFVQGRDQARNHAGFAYATGVSTNYNNRHDYLFLPNFASAANCFK